MSLSTWIDRAITRSGRPVTPDSWEWATMGAALDARCKRHHYLHPRDALGRAPAIELDTIEAEAISPWRELVAE